MTRPKGARDKRKRAPRRRWTAKEDAVLRARYANTLTASLAERFGCSLTATYQRAHNLGLSKSREFIQEQSAARLRRGDHGSIAFRFPKGHVPANKGLRRPGWGPGRMKETQFRKGERRGVAVRLYKPIGTERISKDGYRDRKVNDGLPLQRRWRAVHLVLWESVHGPLPKGHAVAFKNGDKTDIRLENFELITRRELMARNTVHNLPKPIARAVQLLGALNRQINRRSQAHEEQDRGPAQSPVRDARVAESRRQADGARPRESDRRRRPRSHRVRQSRGAVPPGHGSARRDRVRRATARA